MQRGGEKRELVGQVLELASACAVGKRSSLLLVQGSHARQHLALQQLQKGTTAGGHVGDLVGDAGLLSGSHGVTTAHDGGAALGGQLSQGVGNALWWWMKLKERVS